MAYTEHSLWLIPSEPRRTALRSIINELASSLDAVAFEPHVTVCCGQSTDVMSCELADRIASQFAPIELICDTLATTEQFTKTLFIQFQDSHLISQMSELAKASYTQRSNYTLNPHLSLLYKKFSTTTLKHIRETLDVRMDTCLFDRVRIIETELPIHNADPIERWRVVCEVELVGF